MTKRQRLFGDTALSLMQAALGWLLYESNVSKAELEDLQQLLEQMKRQCAKSKELPGIAVRDLKMKQVESIFKIKILKANQSSTTDLWNLEDDGQVSDLQPEEFAKFYDFLSECSLLSERRKRTNFLNR